MYYRKDFFISLKKRKGWEKIQKEEDIKIVKDVLETKPIKTYSLSQKDIYILKENDYFSINIEGYSIEVKNIIKFLNTIRKQSFEVKLFKTPFGDFILLQNNKLIMAIPTYKDNESLSLIAFIKERKKAMMWEEVTLYSYKGYFAFFSKKQIKNYVENLSIMPKRTFSTMINYLKQKKEFITTIGKKVKWKEEFFEINNTYFKTKYFKMIINILKELYPFKKEFKIYKMENGFLFINGIILAPFLGKPE